MTYRVFLQTALAAAAALTIPAVVPGASYEEAVHPLCRQDPRDPCVKLTMNFKGTPEITLVFDRIEAKVNNTCKVPMQSGKTDVASTDSLTLPDVEAKTETVGRAFWFPKGCYIWFHLREPMNLEPDRIVSQTVQLTESHTVEIGPQGGIPDR